MDYIKLEENLRVGYEIEKRKDKLAIATDYILNDKELANNVYFRYKILGLKNEDINTEFKSLVKVIKKDINTTDIIKNSMFGVDILRLVKKEIDNNIWENIVGKEDLPTIHKELIKVGNKELEKEINKVSKDKIGDIVFNNERLAEELLETNNIGKVNSMLKNKLIIKHRIFYGTLEQNIVYMVMDFENEEDIFEKRERIEEKFECMNTILNGGAYKVNVVLEENKLYQELYGDKIINIWEKKDEILAKEIIATPSEVAEKVGLELEKMIGTKCSNNLADKIIIR